MTVLIKWSNTLSKFPHKIETYLLKKKTINHQK